MTMSHNILRHSLIVTLSTITYYVNLNGLVLTWLGHSSILIYHTHITRLWYNIIQLVYINTTRGTIFTNIWSHYYSVSYMAIRCISPLLFNLQNISNIVKIGGGGLCGEKHTHLLIHIVTPPNIYAYKCLIKYHRVSWRNHACSD